MEEKYSKLESLCKDPELMEQVFVEDQNQTLSNLAAQGIQMTREEYGEFAAGVLQGIRKNSKEDLDEEALSAVAGGAKKTNRGFIKGMKDSGDDYVRGTCKGAQPSGFLYALGYSVSYGILNYL